MVFLVSFHMVFPKVVEDGYVEFLKYRDHYSWMTFHKFIAISAASYEFKVPIDKICSLINSESEGDSRALSHSGARGLMQVMPCHYKGNINDLYDISINVRYGTKYLRWCLDFANGNFDRAIIAYNAGPGLHPKNYPNALRKNYLEVIKKNNSITMNMINRHKGVQ